MAGEPSELRAKLERIDDYERGVRATWVHRFFQTVGPTPWFGAVYRRLGPRVDPWLFRATRGKLANRIYGFKALLLGTIGARTGAPRTSPLLYVRDGDAFVVVGTNFGTENHPAWTGNLLKTPAATIEVGGESFGVTAQLCDEATFERLWPKFREVYRGYDVYLARLTERRPRMFRLEPVGAN
jgi:deazaflavin-dependent oxidoreductase (nitroreductase family)